MDRLTERIYDMCNIKECGKDMCKATCEDKDSKCEQCPIQEAIDKLAEYEDLEEQGKLLKLPVAVGGEIWKVCKKYGECPAQIRKCTVNYIEISNKGIIFNALGRICSIDDFGVTAFVAREAAEAALKGLNE